MSALEALLEGLPRTALVVGKGGVGKTTCAVGIAALLARRGDRTLLISTDPAAALADVIGAPVGTTESVVAGEPNLEARQLSAADLRRRFLDRWRATIADIVDRGTYLDRGEIDGLVDAAFPGADEIFGLLALADLLAEPAARYARIVVDTAPTGHTLRLLALPDTFRALLSMLDLMQDKHRFMVRALTHRYRRDQADDFLNDVRGRIDSLRATLADMHALAAVLVTRPEPIVVAETRRYFESLRDLRLHVAAVIVNAFPRGGEASIAQALDVVSSVDPGVVHFSIPRQLAPPQGIAAVTAALMQTSYLASRAPASESHRAPPTVVQSRAATGDASPIIGGKTLTLVGGKGGVGKSTVACALAIIAAEQDAGRTLLVSTDPAPSIADAFGMSDAAWARGDVEAPLPDVPGLVVRQMDATAAFARVRDKYQARIDSLFSALVGRGIDVEQDRAIIRELLALAPPGIDELFALSILGDALAEGQFGRIIVDPAPTGHLVRLLEMPVIALDWTHRLMRVMLEYREVVALGDAAQELLDFAKRTRALDALLHDHARSGLVVVALDEPVVRSETIRLVAQVRERGIDVGAIVWNRLTHPPDPLPATGAARQFFAEEIDPAPIGAAALRAWSRSWREGRVSL